MAMTDTDYNVVSGNGGVYLLVVDKSADFQSALKVACDFSISHRARLGLLYVMEQPDFQQWGSVEDQILAEQRRKAEKALSGISQDIYNRYGLNSSFYIEAGEVQGAITEILSEQEDVRALVLGAGLNANPLVSHFSGRGLSSLKVPLVVVPGIS